MIRLIAFDWDDVITLGAKEGYYACYHEAVIGVGIHLDPEEERRRILAKWSKPHLEELGELLKEHPHLIEKAAQTYLENLLGNTYINALTLVEGVNELLLRLHKKYILAVATGAHPKIIKEKVIPTFNIPDIFSEFQFSYNTPDVTKYKPYPYMLQQIMEHQNIRAQEMVFVGDAKSDIEMARAAHVTPIAVLTGQMSTQDTKDLNVKYVIPDVTHLENVLEEINKAL